MSSLFKKIGELGQFLGPIFRYCVEGVKKYVPLQNAFTLFKC